MMNLQINFNNYIARNLSQQTLLHTCLSLTLSVCECVVQFVYAIRRVHIVSVHICTVDPIVIEIGQI